MDCEGKGFIKDTIDYVKKFSLEKLRSRPPQINNLLKKYGNNRVKKVAVCRQELMGASKILTNILTLGTYEKNKHRLNYDKVFHLYMVVYLDNGVSFGIEKNERVMVWYNPKKPEKRADSECIERNSINRPTLNNFIENGEKRGGVNFYRYSAYKNNCQKFVNDLTTSNGLNLSKFVLQDAGSLLEPRFRKLAVGITDIAGMARYLTGGECDECYYCNYQGGQLFLDI